MIERTERDTWAEATTMPKARFGAGVIPIDGKMDSEAVQARKHGSSFLTNYSRH